MNNLYLMFLRYTLAKSKIYTSIKIYIGFYGQTD